MQSRQKIFLGLGGFGLLLLGLLAGLLWAGVAGKTKAPEPKSNTKYAAKTVVIAGDIACAEGDPKTSFSCRHDDTATLIDSLKPDAVLTTGDNQYPVGALAAYQNSYDKTWGAFKNITYPVPGNHEYGTPDAAGYFDYFGERAGERGKGYYSFSVGDWRFIALNSEVDASENSTQVAWLKQELQTNKSTCTLAYWHKPRFSTGGHPSDPTYDALWRVLYANNVDVIANGHSHGYERFAPQNPDGQLDTQKGITQFVSGLGGSNSQKLSNSTLTDTLATRQNHAFGVLKLSLYPKTLHYEFIPTPGQQTFSDSGTVTCH